mgnify:CR=1 FL=1
MDLAIVSPMPEPPVNLFLDLSARYFYNESVFKRVDAFKIIAQRHIDKLLPRNAGKHQVRNDQGWLRPFKALKGVLPVIYRIDLIAAVLQIGPYDLRDFFSSSTTSILLVKSISLVPSETASIHAVWKFSGVRGLRRRSDVKACRSAGSNRNQGLPNVFSYSELKILKLRRFPY